MASDDGISETISNPCNGLSLEHRHDTWFASSLRSQATSTAEVSVV